MVVNGLELLRAAPIKDMAGVKRTSHGVSYGLSEVGYDIRIKQDVSFYPDPFGHDRVTINDVWAENYLGAQHFDGNFALASSLEEFQMPTNLMGVVHDKSTWARRKLSVFNTVIEPGWNGFLTLELVYHGREPLHISAGSGIAQVVFHQILEPASYDGKYQNQGDRPVDAILA